LIIPLLATDIICVLIMLEPNMSITMLVGLSVLIMLICGGIKGRYLVSLALPVFVLVIILIFAEPYRVKRILAFINPWENSRDEGFQLIQSFYALAGGGVFGVGLFNSRQKYTFLPFAESDFIFSIIGEELGFVGAFALILIFTYVVFLGVKVAMKAKDAYSSLLAVGITAIIACQTLLNVAVVTGSIPPTGLPLPFISNGGSSLVVFLYAVGVLIRIGNESESTHLLLARHKMK
ncbi:MAG TPA: FtsW/RodA/SpoVE family cell cycle protein, partial [Clostridia bacterium]|nr:FtsW/RodA/SpoVE family cell cycle protein [Clostridia bacterium]